MILEYLSYKDISIINPLPYNVLSKFIILNCGKIRLKKIKKLNLFYSANDIIHYFSPELHRKSLTIIINVYLSW